MKTLCRKDLHDYQNRAISFIKDKKKCALWLDMGLGKTTSTLTCILDLFEDFAISKVLIIAPLRVANTVWKQECKKWDHLKELDVEICTGTPEKRKRSLSKNSQIYVINRENIPWLMENFKWQWDAVIIDESSSFKSHRSQRFKSLRKFIYKARYVIELTGTPSPNGMMDLWSQIFLLDQGDRLGKNITKYRQSYFHSAGFKGYSWDLNENADVKIKEKVSDICLSMSAEDYLDLPDRIDMEIRVDMPKSAMEGYAELKKEFVLELEDGDIAAPTAGALGMKCGQYANGAVYDENRNWHEVHSAKIEAVKDIFEDYPNETFLIAYNYKHDLERLKKAFPDIVELSESGKELKKWNKGEISKLCCHPASAGHGLNLQYGGNIIIWFGLNWSLELYQQFVKRLDRQGQTKPVRNIHIVTSDTVDLDIMGAIKSKAKTQKELMDYMKEKYVR